MNIVLVNDGTSGDMHPFFAVGRELAQRGHGIVVCTNDVYRASVERLGFRFVSTGTEQEYEANTSNPDMWSSSKARVTAWKEIVVPRLRPLHDLLERQVQGDTLILCGLLTAAFARAVQERRGVPLLTVVLSPQVFFSAKSPAKGMPVPSWLPYPARAGLLRGLDFAIDSVMAPDLNRFRAELGLAPVSRIRSRRVFSPQGTLGLFPEWYAQRQSDWAEKLSLTGFPLFDEGRHAADPVLEEFLAAGAPPLVFTAGTGMRHAHAFFAAAVELLRRLRRRGVFLSKSAQQIPADLPAEILYREYAPMNTLLPRSAALVHHGGIGTTAEALAAGIPQLVVPYAYDQFDNGERLRRLGCGASLKSLTALPEAELALARLLGSDSVRQACRRYQGQIEHGRVAAARAADVVEQLGRDTFGERLLQQLTQQPA
jgi:rhamnosyltransferase subunit B